MAFNLRRFALAFVGSAVFSTALTTSGPAWANGREFFAAPFGKVDLVYTGRARDITGRFLSRAEIVIWSEEYDLTFPSVTDDYGHYRSPDVGANIKEVASKIDLKDLKAACALPGYEQARPMAIPRKAHGVVELNCTLRKTGSVADAARGNNDAERPARAIPPLFWLVPVALVAVVIGGAARR
jgi:hypothetical protein